LFWLWFWFYADSARSDVLSNADDAHYIGISGAYSIIQVHSNGLDIQLQTEVTSYPTRITRNGNTTLVIGSILAYQEGYETPNSTTDWYLYE
jgi:hypothetical protein